MMNRTKRNLFLRLTAVIANGLIILFVLYGGYFNRNDSSEAEVTGLACALLVLDTVLILLEPRYSPRIPDMVRSLAVVGNIALLMVSSVMGITSVVLASRASHRSGTSSETLGAVCFLLAAIILNMHLIRSESLWKKRRLDDDNLICSQCGHIRGPTFAPDRAVQLGALGRATNRLLNQYQPCPVCEAQSSVLLNSAEGKKIAEEMRKSGPFSRRRYERKE